MNKFGTETSVEDLKDVAGYEADTIWLFSVELFHKELLKFNLKIKAQNAETKQATEEAIAKQKAEAQRKKAR